MKRTFTQIITVAILAVAGAAFASEHSPPGNAGHAIQGLAISVGSSSTATESTAPPPEGTISMTEILNEIGALTSQEGQTLAQQQISERDAVKLQAQDTLNQATGMMQGANMMMTMATVELALSAATTGMSVSGIGEASKEGDQAELSAESQSELSIEAQESKLFQIQWDL